ncbi:MAG: hypothetical protein U5J63_04115 [Fodinibius sp.]|nr:hypothetical protein [Fodinibius sp.]
MTNLRNVGGSRQTFEATTRYDQIHSAHNVVINTSSGYAYIVGSVGGGETCGGGLHMEDIADPAAPSFVDVLPTPRRGEVVRGIRMMRNV